MDFDAKIVWKPGMLLTASVLRHRDEDIEEKIRAFRRTLLGSGKTGLLPDYDYHAWGAFSGRVYELMGLRISAMLPSGRIIHVDEDLKLPIPSLEDGDYFLVLGITDRIHEFEMDDVPYSRPEYELSIRKRGDVEGLEYLPLKRFIVGNGILNVEEDYVPPVLLLCQNDIFERYMNGYSETLSRICAHRNMVEGDAKRTLLRFMFRLKSFNKRRMVADFVTFVEELAEAADYFIVDGLGKSVEDMPQEVISLRENERRIPFLPDINTFLKWFDEYLNALAALMDRVVIPDDTIDYEQLKKDIYDELYLKLRAELSSSIREELHAALSDELTESVFAAVRRFVEENVSPELKVLLTGELHDSLYAELYESLYAELSKLSYRPAEVQEDTFNPVI